MTEAETVERLLEMLAARIVQDWQQEQTEQPPPSQDLEVQDREYEEAAPSS